MQTFLENNQDQRSNIDILSQSRCTGCGACYNACPFDAITIQTDDDGFPFPQVDVDACTHCGLCATICPALGPVRNNLENPECYAVWANDEIRMSSSSGGVFTLLADYVLENGGYVCGAAFDDRWDVHHILVDNKADLAALRGSKYVQSDTGKIFQEIKVLLDEEKLVLFSGCPCHVAGIDGFLRKKYGNLITVDIFCHSTASPGVWSKYLKERFADENFDTINSRDKEICGWRCTKCTNTVDGEKHVTDGYVKGFHRGLYARESCEKCQFSQLPRQGDFTIGDWWGIDKFNPALNDNKGTSLLLINNNNNLELVAFMKNRAQLFKAVPLKYIGDNGHLKDPFKLPKKRDPFLSMLRQGLSFSKALSAVMDEKYDIGIMGFWYGLNYGSVLTSYAIYRTVERLGYSAIHLDKPADLFGPRYASDSTFAARFANKYANVSRCNNNFDKMNEHCRMFLVGSDTVWNPKLVGKYQPLFFLDFAASEKRKIAYASSFGRPNFIMEDPSLKQYCQYACNRLDAVSVREDLGVTIMKEEFGRDATRVLDPVFFLDPDEYRSIAQAGRDIELADEYLFSNILGPSETKLEVYEQAVKDLGLPTVNFPNPNITEKQKKEHPLDIVEKISLENWLTAIDCAKLAISDSFHATCFSIILQTDFITVLDRYSPLKGRFVTLLSLLQLEDRIVYTDEKIDFKALAAHPINYEKVKTLLVAEQKSSFAWLKNALQSPTPPVTPERLAFDKICSYFRSELNITQELLKEARIKLRPLRELERMSTDKKPGSAREHLAASFFLRQAIRVEYWRCRLMLNLVSERRKQYYQDRINAVKILISLLIS